MRSGLDLSQFDDRNPTVPVYHHEAWYADLKGCTACVVRPEARQVVPGVGPLSAEFMVLGRNPGEEEDDDGIPFIGAAGKELDKWLDVLGLSRPKLFITNVLKCHTTKNRSPLMSEVSVCVGLWLRKELETYVNLKAILTCGEHATKAVVGKTEVPKGLRPFWVKARMGDPETGRVFHVVPLPHPAYLLRSPGKRPEVYTQLLPKVRDYLARELPGEYERARS